MYICGNINGKNNEQTQSNLTKHYYSIEIANYVKVTYEKNVQELRTCEKFRALPMLW
jgi:hypothetical protein